MKDWFWMIISLYKSTTESKSSLTSEGFCRGGGAKSLTTTGFDKQSISAFNPPKEIPLSFKDEIPGVICNPHFHFLLQDLFLRF
jgi:hypothetical protein